MVGELAEEFDFSGFGVVLGEKRGGEGLKMFAGVGGFRECGGGSGVERVRGGGVAALQVSMEGTSIWGQESCVDGFGAGGDGGGTSSVDGDVEVGCFEGAFELPTSRGIEGFVLRQEPGAVGSARRGPDDVVVRGGAR